MVRKIEERIQNISMKDKFFVQNQHDTFISQKEEVDSHEQIPANSNYHRSEDRFIEQYCYRHIWALQPQSHMSINQGILNP